MSARVDQPSTRSASIESELDRPLLGHVVEVLSSGHVKVRMPVFGMEFLTAGCVEHVAARAGGLASLIGEQVVVMCAAGDPAQAIVCGVVAQPAAAPSVQETEVRAPRPQTALLDGKRVVLEASQEIVLQCGKSSLTLTADGRIVMRGVELVSRALRTNKIKGGTVNIN